MNRPAIDNILRHATEHGSVPGVVAAAANEHGVIYEGASGVRAAAKPDAMTLDTVVCIFSMTKAITSVAALQMVERGKLSLDAPIRDVLPQLAEPQVLESFDDHGAARLRPARAAITLKHLLTHTSGFGYDIWNPGLIAYQERHGIPGVISCQNKALDTPLLFEPGARWEYGINIDWAGKAVEAVSGKTLGAYFAENILGPLGMRDTSFRISPSMRARLAPIHVHGPDGAWVATDIELPAEPEFEMGGGGLYSTIPDYLRFVRMLLNGGILDGARLLDPETIAQATSNQIGAMPVTKLPTAMPQFSADAEFFPGQAKGWGLVGMINHEKAPSGRSAGAVTWAGLANLFWWVDRERDLAAVLGTQTLPFGDPTVMELLHNYEVALH